MSNIAWTDKAWNPLRARHLETGAEGWACVKVSEGCKHCYAETLNEKQRFGHGTGLAYTVPNLAKVEHVLHEETLTEPLHWKKPRMIFVCSMTDLFGEWVTDEQIDRIFAVMALTPQHTYQVLTKRPERMRQYLSPGRAHPVGLAALGLTLSSLARNRRSRVGAGTTLAGDVAHLEAWPLPNVWLGTSVEDQARADERVPILLDTPAAVRFLSMEPLLEAVDLTAIDKTHESDPGFSALTWTPDYEGTLGEAVLDWVIVGGESGPGARPFSVGWARSLRDQCKAAGVPFFMKQMGSAPMLPLSDRPDREWIPNMQSGLWRSVGESSYRRNERGERLGFKVLLLHPHGSKPDEWPEDLRVREFPGTAVIA